MSYLKPLEWTLNHEERPAGGAMREDNSVFVKLITHIPDKVRRKPCACRARCWHPSGSR